MMMMMTCDFYDDFHYFHDHHYDYYVIAVSYYSVIFLIDYFNLNVVNVVVHPIIFILAYAMIFFDF